MNHQSCKISSQVGFIAIIVQLSKLFSINDNTYNGEKSKLQTIWDQLSSDTIPTMLEWTKKISTVKAQAFKGPLKQSYSSDDGKLAYISEFAVAMAVTNDDAIASLF